MTSWPASTARAAATAESTPPDIAASTLTPTTSVARSHWFPGRNPPERATRLQLSLPYAVLAGAAGPLDDRADRRRRRHRRRPASRCGRARTAATRGPAPRGRPSRAARGSAAARRPSRPTRWSTRCRGRPAAAAARRPRSRGTRSARCPAAGARSTGRGRRRGRRPGTTSSTRRTRSSRSPASRSARSALPLAGHLGGGGEPDDGRGVEGAGADVALLPAAVQHRHQVDWLRPSTSSADPERSADLVTGHGHRVQTAGGEVDRQLPEGLHGVGVERHAVAPRATAASSPTGCTVPTSLFAHMTVTSATEPGPRRSRPRASDGCTRPAASTGSHSTTAPSCSASQSDGVHHGVVLDGAGQDAATSRVLAAALPEQALDREVVRLGAAAGEEDLAGAGAQRGGQRLAGLLDQPPRGATRGVQRGRVAGRARAGRPSPRRPRGPSAWSPRGRGRRCRLDTAVGGWGHRRRSLRRGWARGRAVAPGTGTGSVSPCAP